MALIEYSKHTQRQTWYDTITSHRIASGGREAYFSEKKVKPGAVQLRDSRTVALNLTKQFFLDKSFPIGKERAIPEYRILNVT